MKWILILTFMSGYNSTETVQVKTLSGFASQAECQRAARQVKATVGAQLFDKLQNTRVEAACVQVPAGVVVD